MKVRVWGSRGSLPVALSAAGVRGKIKAALTAARGRTLADDNAVDKFITEDLPWETSNTFGGNSSCVQIDAGGAEYILCDLGSGLREFGVHMLAQHGPAKPQTYNVFLSHLHWDHIMGFPFFTPAYIKGNHIRIHACHPDPEAAFRRQQSAPCFPVGLDMLGAKIEFIVMQPGTPITVAGSTVTAMKQYHEGDSFGYRFERKGKAIVYSTDSEHKQENKSETQSFVDFFRNADLVIFDAMYSLADAISLKQDWGHSSNIVGVELCRMAGVKHLMLFHHEPVYDDAMLRRILQETIRYEELERGGEGPALTISSAYDGLELDV
ncbi:MAG: MBL fold metallo-hydrolase [Rhodospirillaceae bacterium]|nr:MBL fold metallo-hydrolase [Rhodospirillaceae bacterium]